MESSQEKILELFFNFSMKRFYIRELSRLTSLNTKTIMSHLKEFTKKNIIKKIKKKNKYPYYYANITSKSYIFEKKTNALKKIMYSGLIEFLEKKTKAKKIILFGSMQKGSYYDGSDIDIFLNVKEIKLDLDKFENKLDRNINLLFEKDPKYLSKGLSSNIFSGYILNDYEDKQKIRI